MKNSIFFIPLIFMAWQPLLNYSGKQNRYSPNPLPAQKHKFTVIAHRGDHMVYPENTLQAYAQAIKDGADYVEIDLRTTKDKQLVSLHNDDVERMTNGSGLIKDMLFKDVEQLRIKGGNTAEIFRIPAFGQILKLCKNKIYLYIDFKDADPAIVNSILQQYGMQNQVLVYINEPTQLFAWRHVNARIPLMLSPPDSIPDGSILQQFLEKYKPDVLDGDYKQYNKELLALAASYHLPVWPDAQSNTEGPAVWEAAIARGLQGLQTDHPQELINYLRKK